MNRTATTHRTARTMTRLVAIAPLLALVACGDDDGDDAAGAVSTVTEPAAAPDVSDASAFCAVATELDDSDGPPTIEQLQAYAEVAPAELTEPVATIIELFEQADGNVQLVFTDPDGIAAVEQLAAVEAEVCGLGEAADGTHEIDPAATRVDIAATDYHFDAEFPTAAGRYSFVMTNDGEEIHLMVLAHLEDDADLDEVLASEGEVGVLDMYESDIATPGGEAVLTADLTAGRWVVLCPIPDADGVVHIEHGMIHEFDVT